MNAQMKMKELESQTGVNREAIRFYIREGLLPEPEKPRRNVAYYTKEHVERIRLIKKLQDEHFLPLKRVKAVLDHGALGKSLYIGAHCAGVEGMAEDEGRDGLTGQSGRTLLRS